MFFVRAYVRLFYDKTCEKYWKYIRNVLLYSTWVALIMNKYMYHQNHFLIVHR